MTQAHTPGPLSAEDELIERGLRTIRTYDAVRYLRDALTATTARLTGYDWNADPESITKQQGDAFSAADRVFADLESEVAAYPDIDLPRCEACNGTGKIEEPARTEGANQHSACVRSCDECDGCGFAPDPELAPTAPVEASGSGREHGPKCWGKTSISDEMMYCYCGSTDSPPGETREALDRLKMAAHVYEDDEMAADCATLEALLSARPLALGGQHSGGEVARWGLKDDNGVVQCLTYDDKVAAEVAANRCSVRLTPFPLYTTPARAEAQDEGAAGEPVAYGADHQPWCQPGDQTDRAFRLRFEDPDMREMVWTGPDAEREALAAYNQYAPSWNVYLFSGHPRAHPSPPPAADEDRVRIGPDLVERLKGWPHHAQGADYSVASIQALMTEAADALKSEGK